jgi:hypothetical protein
MVGRCCCLRLASITFITRVGFSTSTLAYMLDSLVRVSRRVSNNHFSKIAQGPSGSMPTSTGDCGFPGHQAFVDMEPHFASRARIQLLLPQMHAAAVKVLKPAVVRQTPSFTPEE